MMLIALICLVFFLPDVSVGRYLNPIIWGLIAAVLIFSGIYFYWGHRKGLWIVFLLLIFCSSNALADNCSGQTGCAYHKCMVTYYMNKADYCKLREFDVDEAVKNSGKAPKEEDINNAQAFLDARQKWKNAGCRKTRYSEHFHLKQYACAASYLTKVAEFEKKKREQYTKTVYQKLEADKDSCWPCGLIHVMMAAVENLTLAVEDELCKAALLLLGIMFLFWLLFKVLLLIGQFGTANNA